MIASSADGHGKPENHRAVHLHSHEPLSNLPAPSLDILLFQCLRHKNCKFVASAPSDQAAGGKHFLQHRRNILEQLIPDNVAVCVVDLFKLVDIHENH